MGNRKIEVRISPKKAEIARAKLLEIAEKADRLALRWAICDYGGVDDQLDIRDACRLVADALAPKA